MERVSSIPSKGRGLGGRIASSQAGSVTAEYAVATVAACGFAGVLYKILTSSQVLDLVVSLFTKALSLIF